MTITALLENVSNSGDLQCAHGLSLYIETDKHKILFDSGPNELFADNAQTLGIPLEDVDIAVISHGHHDHGGGLKRFMELNSKAQIYVRKAVFDPHFSKTPSGPHQNGLETSLLETDRFVFTEAQQRIDDELLLFSEVPGNKYHSASNDALFKRDSAGVEHQDDFDHEQSLLITGGGKTVLIGGCAHRGIVNILEYAEELAGGPMDVVVSGFHLFNPNTGETESDALVDGIASALGKRSTQFYTCHCTGIKGFETLQQRLGGQVQYLSTGTVVTI